MASKFLLHLCVLPENEKIFGFEACFHAVSAYVNADPVYQGAPTFSYAVGSYIIDKAGTLSGPADPALAAALSEKGFTAA